VIDRHRPVTIRNDGISAVAAGKSTSLAIAASGAVFAWGANDDGRLGTGWAQKQLEPKQVIAERKVDEEGNTIEHGAKAAAAGWHHCLVLMDNGDVLAWGGNEYGQLGDGSKEPKRVPSKVSLPGPAIAIASGWHHSLVLLASGEVLVWGFNNPDKSGFRTDGLPRTVLRHSVSAIDAGGVHSLALTTTGILLAWGGNDKGQLGDASEKKQATPVPVASGVSQLAAGNYHSLAVDKEDLTIMLWGYTAYHLPGPAGDATFRMEKRPLTVPLDADTYTFHAVSAGGDHSMAVSMDGEVFVWGGNASGQVGDGSTSDASLPKMVLGPGTIQVKSHEEIVASLMGNVQVLDDSGDIHRQIVEKPKGRSIEDQKPATVPELLLRASGAPTQFAPQLTSTATSFPAIAPHECSSTELADARRTV